MRVYDTIRRIGLRGLVVLSVLGGTWRWRPDLPQRSK